MARLLPLKLVTRRVLTIVSRWALAQLFLTVAGVLTAASQPPAAQPPLRTRVAVLPFQNMTGDKARNDWEHALPAEVRSCLGGAAECTEILEWKKIRAVLERAGWKLGQPADLKLARQVARDLNAGIVVWGKFLRQTNRWIATASILRADSQAAPVEITVASPGWADLAESLALSLAENLGCGIAADDRQHWNQFTTRTNKAEPFVAKFFRLEAQDAPASEKEKALRQILNEDPFCGLAHFELVGFLVQAERIDDAEKAILDYLRRVPQSCASHYWMAWVLSSNGDKPDAQREALEALRLHRGCPGAARALFMVLGSEKRWSELRQFLEQAHKDRPAATQTTAFLAWTLTQAGDLEGADKLLDEVNELPEEDEVVDVALLGAALLTVQFELAGRELARLGPKAGESDFIRDTLNSFRLFRREHGDSAMKPVLRPQIFTASALNAELQRRLLPEERKLVINPVEVTSSIAAEARRLTIGLTNQGLQAIALFSEVARRGRGPGEGSQRTASQALKVSEDPETRFSCQEYAKLFVALARALGLEAWLTHIDRDVNGFPGYHDCAAFFVGDLGLLVDPTWRVFGIQHQTFSVLDDLQAISHQAMQPTRPLDAHRPRMGLKLNPEDRWTRVQFVGRLADIGEYDEAEKELQKLTAANSEQWDVEAAAAHLESAREHWKPALAAALRALALSPSNAVVHADLAHLYAKLEEPAKAREHLEAALQLNRGEISAEFRRQSPLQLAFLQALAQNQSGAPSSESELRRQAESGDLAAQMALAKICFDSQPPRLDEAQGWLLKAALQGNALAQRNYARNLFALYPLDKGKEVVHWFTLAAEQGDDEAQFHLGFLYYEGKVAPKDDITASQWIFLAADDGNADARRLLPELKLFVSPKDLAEGRKRADAFKPTTKPLPNETGIK